MIRKRIITLLICLSMTAVSCAAPAGGGVSAGTGGEESAAADTAAEAAAETEADPEDNTEAGRADGAAGTAPVKDPNEKPELVIMGREEEDYSRAVQNKKAADTDVRNSALYAAADIPKLADKNYTVMVYIVGSNLESRYGAATNDIKEMLGAGLDFSKNNLLVYAGGSKRWNSDISNTYNSVIDLAAGDSLEVTARTDETADMGTAETISQFINYCTENYPARHYGLVLWDHGAGPLWGYGSDELFGNDSLLLEELKGAMDKTMFTNGKKLDWVGFDACLMGSIENAKLWKDYADYMIGSEELEPGRGWDYSFLGTLNKTENAGEIAASVVEAYGNYYEKNRSEVFNPDVTLSAMDLSAVDDTIQAADMLFEAMQKGIDGGDYAELNRARSRTKAFGLGAASSREEAYDMLDMRDLTEQLAQIYPEECRKVQGALDKLVVASTANVSGAGGVSIYLPGDNQALYSVAGELYSEDSALSDPYQDFVGSYMEAWKEGSGTDWTLNKLEEGDGELTMQLTQEQVRNASEFHYSILQRNSFGSYALATGKVQLEPDENNVLHIPADPMLVAAATDMEEPSAPLTCTQIEHSGGESVYRTINMFLTPGHEYADIDVTADEQVVITAKSREGERELSVLDITSSAGSAWAGGKASVDVSNFESIINAGSTSHSPVRDDEGHMKPFYEWKYTGYEMYPMCLDKGFRIIMKPASEFNREFICQVIVKDVNGVQHASDFRELNEGSSTEFIEVPTEKGTLYALAEDSGICIDHYEGEDEKIEIPASLEGRPVTKIGAYAFAKNKTISAITLPDTVEEIGKEAFCNMKQLTQASLSKNLKTIGIGAFRYSGLTQIDIPESVESIRRAAFADSALTSADLPEGISLIGSMPFADCAHLTEIRIGDGNPNYKTADGVLYTADGKVLIQYPCAAADEYAVPEGTEEIGYGAFSSSGIREISLPSSLRTIGNFAFYDCSKLSSLQLPDSLESIGAMAFSSFDARYHMTSDEEKSEAGTIHLGPNVRYIGNGAFDALKTKAFEVDEGNPQFASLGGFITGKAKDMIISEPRGTGSVVVIPDGITTLQDYVLSDLKYGTEFVIPDSVFRIGELAFPYSYGELNEEGRYDVLYMTKFHCSEGSAAEKFAKIYEIPYDNITDPGELNYEEVTEEIPAEGERGASKMIWYVFGSHAELVGCQSDEFAPLEIPSEYKGLPVTALRCSDDPYSSYWCRAEKVIIPDTVVRIDREFFDGFHFLKEIETGENNPAYTSIDGVLFTKDMKAMIDYPIKKEDQTYSVPDKVEEISDHAAYMNRNIRKLTLPRSLRKIGDNAFTSCSALTEASFNKGLREIGKYAFNSTPLSNVSLPSSVTSIGNSVFMLNAEFGTLILPDKLQTLGYKAFSTRMGETFGQESIKIPKNLKIETIFLSGVLFDRFETDSKCENYTAKDGVLMSKDEKTLVSVPTLREGEFTVPEGTLYIEYNAFNECDRITDIYIPDTILSIGNIAEKDYSTGEYKYVIHCRKGTEAQKQLESKGALWVPIE